MSATLQSTGLFTSRKRRTGQAADSIKQEAKRPFAAGNSRHAGPSGLSRPQPAGATAPTNHNSHVQEAIHEEVRYSREGEAKVPENTMAVFRFVQKAFVIPEGFEKNRKFGTLSGMSHELRVVSAYMGGQLKARSKSDAKVKMCLLCGKKGHFPRYCPAAMLV